MSSEEEFGLISLDPPWNEAGGGKIKRGADRHYPLLKTHEMPRVILQSGVWRPADDAHLYMWATNNFLPDALWLIKALGFRYVTNLAWVKVSDSPKKREELLCHLVEFGRPASQSFGTVTQRGLGQYFPGGHELLLFAVNKKGRGTTRRSDAKGPSTVFYAPRGEHSAKPRVAYDIMEQRTDAEHRLEMFAREPREGWTVWGNEVPEPGPEETEEDEAAEDRHPQSDN